MLSEKPDTKDDILSDSIYMKFPEKAKQRERADPCLHGTGKKQGLTANGMMEVS